MDLVQACTLYFGVNWKSRLCTQFRAKRNSHGHARGAHTNLYLLISESNNVYLFRSWLAWWPFNMRWISANVAHPRAREADTLQLCGTIKLMFCALRVNFWPFAETNYNTLCKSVLEKKNSKLGQSDGSARDAQIDFIAHQTSESAPSSSVRVAISFIASHRLKKSSSSVASREHEPCYFSRLRNK